MLRLLACAAVVCGASSVLTPAPIDPTDPNKVVGHHDGKLSKASPGYDTLAFPFKTAFKPAYENVTFSFYGVCSNIEVCFPYGRSMGVDGAGPFSRDMFRRSLANAYNTRVFAERRKLIDFISRESPEAVEEIEATQSIVKRYLLDIQNNDIYTFNRATQERFFFDRVMEINDPRDFSKVEVCDLSFFLYILYIPLSSRSRPFLFFREAFRLFFFCAPPPPVDPSMLAHTLCTNNPPPPATNRPRRATPLLPRTSGTSLSASRSGTSRGYEGVDTRRLTFITCMPTHTHPTPTGDRLRRSLPDPRA